ncbi:MAG: putative manganese-dependent inorganic diphosphatase [Verrucomicrobia bacterium]|nr:putative manganese-dependent inorganic diphosphatase [Verrucomicrobiota bacterium]
MKEAPTYIIGHRNPDADAICSAIGYAALKRAKGETRYTAARCGNTNVRIDAILNRFNVPLPPFIGDVTPRVRDIMKTEVKKVHTQSTCKEALEIMDEFDLRCLPVVDENNRLQGSVSIFDLGDYFIPKPRQERKMRQVHTSLRKIVEALNAQVIFAFEPDREEDLFVRIGAMDIRSFGKFYSDDQALAGSSVIVVGDRYDIQHRSLQLGVRMIVITGNLPVEPDVISVAKERGVSLIVSPEDSATTSLIIRSAGIVDNVMSTKTFTVSPEEKLSVVKRKVTHTRALACMVVDEDNSLLGVFTNSDLLKPVQKSLILVDHNELSQAVAGADQVHIAEIIDHHRLGNAGTQQPILFINSPVGSTCTIIADLFQREGIDPDPAIAGVLMGGIISDTLNLKGPTTTDKDSEILQWLASLAGIASDDLADIIFSSGSVILGLDPDDVIQADCKLYDEEGVRFSVSQVEELGYENFWQREQAIEEALEAYRAKEDLLFSCLMVTDIYTQNSLLIVRGDEVFLDSISYPRKDRSDVFEMTGVVSRKKQLVPYLSSVLRSSGMQGASLASMRA